MKNHANPVKIVAIRLAWKLQYIFIFFCAAAAPGESRRILPAQTLSRQVFRSREPLLQASAVVHCGARLHGTERVPRFCIRCALTNAPFFAAAAGASPFFHSAPSALSFFTAPPSQAIHRLSIRSPPQALCDFPPSGSRRGGSAAETRHFLRRLHPAPRREKYAKSLAGRFDL